MPSGKVHAKCSLCLAPIVLIAVTNISLICTGTFVYSAIAGVLAGLGCLLGVLLTPDLDQESINSVEYKIIRWTMGLGFIWTMVWFPYAVATDHRGILSHFPFIGTLGRLLYISAWTVLIIYVFGWAYPAINWGYLGWVVLGLLVSDIAHWALDVRLGDPFDQKKRYHGNRKVKIARSV